MVGVLVSQNGDSLPGYDAGDRVRHRTFGPGTILGPARDRPEFLLVALDRGGYVLGKADDDVQAGGDDDDA
jgi:hypothetical protein